MRPSAPEIDERSFEALLEELRSKIPFYTPEWVATREQDCGQALLKIYVHMLEQVITRLNKVPENNLIAFLDTLGTRMLPAQPARAVVTFSLAEGTTEHVPVAKGTQLAAEGAVDGKEVLFETESELRVTPAKIQEVFSLDPLGDSIFRHTDNLSSGTPFDLFAGTNQQERSLYIGDSDLLSQTNPSNIIISLVLAEGATPGEMDLAWEYWNGERWAGLVTFAPGASTPNDTTALLSRTGEMSISKDHNGEIPVYEQHGMKSRWLRCRLRNVLQSSAAFQLPRIKTLLLSVEPIKPFPAELAFNNDVSLNLQPIRLEMEAMGGTTLAFIATDLPKKGATQFNVAITSGGLQVDDFIKLDNKLDNGINDPEIVVIKTLTVTAGKGEITTGNPLLFDYYSTSTISLMTSLRTDGTAVIVKGLEGLDVGEDSKVTLIRGVDSELATIDTITKTPPARHTLTLERTTAAKRAYMAGDTILMTPQIKPFGELPILFDTFYVASDEGFSKRGATITLNINSEWDTHANPRPSSPAVTAVLSWEYWNGKSWRGLQVADTTNRFENQGNITFTCPSDIDKIEVSGEEKFWIRVRIIDGDYGKELLVEPDGSANVKITKGTIVYPVISDLTISYEGQPREPQQCFTLNNLDLEDHTEALLDRETTFAPFAVLSEQSQSLFLGFDQRIEGGPLRLLFNLEERGFSANEHVGIDWFYWNDASWVRLNVEDGTADLSQIGLLSFAVPSDFAAQELFDKKLFWIKGSLVQGRFLAGTSGPATVEPEAPRILAIVPNSAYAVQTSVVEDEPLGTSDLTANQQFSLLNPLVISQEIFITESAAPSEDERREILREERDDAIQPLQNERGENQGYRIRWHAVDDFYESGPKSRHYTVDQRRGVIAFGDGVNGMVPPSGTDNIRANYRFGGGTNGNVLNGKIASLKNAVPFISEVTNHLPADGGSETETLEEALVRGPERLKNRSRAVTSEDFEALARNASRKVARAKCLPNTDEHGEVALGHVTVLIVPDTQKANEPPSRLLRTVVSDYLQRQSANVLSAYQRIHVRGADFINVVVTPTVVPTSLDTASGVEKRIMTALNQFLDPLKGGPNGEGWEFGQAICRSQLFALLEGVEEVDHVKELIVWVNGKKADEDIRLGVTSLGFSGEHKISIDVEATLRSQGIPRVKSQCRDAPFVKYLEQRKCR